MQVCVCVCVCVFPSDYQTSVSFGDSHPHTLPQVLILKQRLRTPRTGSMCGRINNYRSKREKEKKAYRNRFSLSLSLSLSSYLSVSLSRSEMIVALTFSDSHPEEQFEGRATGRGGSWAIVVSTVGRDVPPQRLSSAVVSLPPGLLSPACGTTSKQTIGLRVSIDDPTALTPNVIV